MLKEKAGIVAGQIWTVLNGTDGLTHKQIKKATKLIDKDLFLGLGWLLREEKMRWYMNMLSTRFFYLLCFHYLCAPD